MTNNHLILIGTASTAVALALAIGPVGAGYVFAGVGLMLVVAFIGGAMVKHVREWGLEHHWPHFRHAPRR